MGKFKINFAITFVILSIVVMAITFGLVQKDQMVLGDCMTSDKPSNVVAKTTTNSVTISWDAKKEAKKYVVYQQKSKKGKKYWKKLKTTTKTCVKVKKLQKNKKYKFAVEAVWTPKKGIVTSTKSVVSAKTKMLKDIEFVFDNDGLKNGKVGLAGISSDCTITYQLYKSKDNVSFNKIQEKKSSANSTRFVVKKEKSYYKIRAYKKIKGIKYYTNFTETVYLGSKDNSTTQDIESVQKTNFDSNTNESSVTMEGQNSPCPRLKADSTAFRILELMNAERELMGVQPLEMDEQLTYVASLRAKEASIKFSHDRPNGYRWGTILYEDKIRINFKHVGENLYKGYLREDGTVDSDRIYTAWYMSDSHRDAMLNGNYGKVGIAIYIVGNEVYAQQTFHN